MNKKKYGQAFLGTVLKIYEATHEKLCGSMCFYPENYTLKWGKSQRKSVYYIDSYGMLHTYEGKERERVKEKLIKQQHFARLVFDMWNFAACFAC